MGCLSDPLQKISKWTAWVISLLKLLLGKGRGQKQSLKHSMCFPSAKGMKSKAFSLPGPLLCVSVACFWPECSMWQLCSMGWGRRNRFGVQLRLERCLAGLVSFTSAPAVITLLANKSYSEGGRNLDSVSFTGLNCSTKYYALYKYTRVGDLCSHACISNRRLHSKGSNLLNWE